MPTVRKATSSSLMPPPSSLSGGAADLIAGMREAARITSPIAGRTSTAPPDGVPKSRAKVAASRAASARRRKMNWVAFRAAYGTW